ncbi:MAG TPA: hypothetical protein V6D03_03555, partial [Candidatus Caenarcaniphilales bacterium]
TTVHHAISDGLSCVRLHAEILTYCQHIASEPIPQVACLSALPPLESLLPESMKGIRGVMNNVFFLLRLGFQTLRSQPKTLGFEKYVPIESRRSGMVHRKLDKSLTQQLVAYCKQQKTTVQGALGAAMLFAVARQITAGEKIPVCVSCRSIVDLRKRLEPVVSDEHLGVLASSVISFHRLRTSTLFWDLAREVKQQLEAGLDRDHLFSVVLMFKQMILFLLAHPHQVPVTVAITNVGRVDIASVYGQFELEEISLVTSLAAFGGVFAAGVSTFKEKMLLNFMFSEPSISQEKVEMLANEVVSCLVDACSQEATLVFKP